MSTLNNNSHPSLTAALSSIQSLQAQGYNSLKLYKSGTLWWVGLSNVCVINQGEK